MPFLGYPRGTHRIASSGHTVANWRHPAFVSGSSSPQEAFTVSQEYVSDSDARREDRSKVLPAIAPSKKLKISGVPRNGHCSLHCPLFGVETSETLEFFAETQMSGAIPQQQIVPRLGLDGPPQSELAFRATGKSGGWERM